MYADDTTVTASDFSWDAFPPPPPEVDEWQPDPDSVARPGTLPDPRFGRDPYEEAKIAAFKKETGLYHVPADIAASLKSRPSNDPIPRSSGPSWAAPLEKALMEETKAPIIQPAKEPNRIPPHLREPTKSASGTSSIRLDPATKTYEPQTDDHGKKPFRVFEMEAAEAILNEEDKHLGSPSSPDPKSRPHGNHGHWIKTRMVIIMEEDLDLAMRATKRELMAMTDEEINRYLQKVSSAHEHWWEAEPEALRWL